MNQMPETTIYEVPYRRSYRTFNGGNNVDIVGVHSSILCMPTIQSPTAQGFREIGSPVCVVLHRFVKPEGWLS